MAPTVRMRALISGSRDGKKWPKPGETLEVPEAEAAQLIAQGIAASLDSEETATVAVETGTATTPAGNKSLAAMREQARAEAEAQLKAEAEAKEKAEAEAKEKAAAEAAQKEADEKAKAEAAAAAKAKTPAKPKES